MCPGKSGKVDWLAILIISELSIPLVVAEAVLDTNNNPIDGEQMLEHNQ